MRREGYFSLVDSAKTGFVIDKKRIEQIRQEYGKKYPDFLGKDEGRSYVSNSIVGKLYRNALNYINGNVNELEANFAQMNIDDDNGHLSTMNSSAVRRQARLFLWRSFVTLVFDSIARSAQLLIDAT